MIMEISVYWYICVFKVYLHLCIFSGAFLLCLYPRLAEPAPAPQNHHTRTGLNRLKSKGWYKSLIALHDQEERQELIQTWGQFKKLWIPQPLERIRLYFGEKVAMYFAWIGMLTTWLWIPSILGIIVGIYS